MASRPRPAGARRHEADQGRDGLQPQQSDRIRPDERRDGRGGRRRRPGRARGSSRTRSIAEPRWTSTSVADVLGPLRQGRRDERPVEGVRDAGPAPRMDARAAGAHPRHVGPSRLHDADAIGDLGQARGVRDGPGGTREHLRPDARDHPREPAASRGLDQQQGDVFTYARPIAGAIAYVKYHLPVGSTELADRVREERSVLLVPGDMFGAAQRHPVRVRLRHRAHDEGPRTGGGPAHRPRHVTARRRCGWAPLDDPEYLAYHDEEWGVPLHDDARCSRS